MHCTHDKGKLSLFLFPKQEYVLIKLLDSLTVWVTFLFDCDNHKAASYDVTLHEQNMSS